MDMNYRHLDSRTRLLMVQEVQFDINAGRVDPGKRLTRQGEADYLDLLLEAARNGNHETFAQGLRRGNRMARRERTKSSSKRVPNTAADTKAIGAFNHYYMRAICCRAIADSGPDAEVQVYRAGQRSQERPESQNAIGASLRAADLLRHWQTQPQEDAPPGLPIGPNSGLSLELID